jgi:uncharacterized phage-associated protein
MIAPALRFRLDEQKCIEGIQFLALHTPGITQFYIGKIFFFADRKHLADWGRPISGDRYVAMEHGPVPSHIYDLVKSDSGEPDDVQDELSRRVVTIREGNKIRVFPKDNGPEIRSLSDSDREYLLESLKKCKRMSFRQIKDESHKDVAYQEAWSAGGLNNEMDIRLWFKPEQVEYLLNNSGSLRRPITRL